MVQVDDTIGAGVVALRVRAWIETFKPAFPMPGWSVALRVRAWIETWTYQKRSSRQWAVALRVRAWIETEIPRLDAGPYARRPPREGVD